jgi:hypothetical protein
MLRFTPPGAALAVAFVLQVVLITDLVGTQLADRQADTGPPWIWYTLAGTLGVAVATSIEMAAAYLMWLYDQHLRKRDSVWQLRLGMVGYVAVSAMAIHWWLGYRGLPELIAWVLAGMSGSSLWLWSRGSRWSQRQEMLSAGQIDPALPRLPTAAKLLHPIRSVITTFLISWEPVSTVDEARARYESWRIGPHWWLRTPAVPTEADRQAQRNGDAVTVRPDTDAGQEPDSPLAPVRSINSRTGRNRPRRAAREVSDEELARELDRSFPDRVPGVPTAMPHLRKVFGSCSRDRASAAVRRLSGWRDSGQVDTDDEEPEVVAA